MKHLSKLPILTTVCAIFGFVCLCVRQWLVSTGIDSKGLLIPGHSGTVISLLLLGIVVCVLCLSLKERQVYHFSPTPLSAVSMLFFAIGCGHAAWKLLSSRAQTLSLITGILGAVSALCALLLAFAQYRKLRLHPFVYCPLVLFFMFFLVCRYQQWSGESELQRYLFPMLSVVALMFSAYHRAALETDRKGIKPYLLISRGAIFFCLAAIPGSSYGLLYGCAAAGLMLDGFTTAKKQGE